MIMMFAPMLQALMIPEQELAAGFTFQSLLLGTFKVMFMILAFLYVAFAVIVIRQIKLMKSTVVTSLSPALVNVGFANLITAIAVLILFFFLL
jgi:hypothetical protein